MGPDGRVYVGAIDGKIYKFEPYALIKEKIQEHHQKHRMQKMEEAEEARQEALSGISDKEEWFIIDDVKLKKQRA